jgi:hypothetical protein
MKVTGSIPSGSVAVAESQPTARTPSTSNSVDNAAEVEEAAMRQWADCTVSIATDMNAKSFRNQANPGRDCEA